MIIRVESGLTIQVDGIHYVKEVVALEMSHEEVAKLLREVAPLHDDLPSDDDIAATIKAMQAGTEDTVLEAVLEQIKLLRKAT